MTWIDIGLRAAVVSHIVLISTLLIRVGRPLSTSRIFALVLGAGIVAYMYCSLPQAEERTIYAAPLIALCIANPILFWLFVNSVFDDAFRLQVWHVVTVIAVVALGMWSHDHPSPAALLVNRAIAIGLIVTSLWAALRGRAADLLEHRRHLRDWLIAIIGVYMLIVAAAEITLAGQTPPASLGTMNIAMILVITHLVSHGLTRVDARVFEVPVSTAVAHDVLPEPQRRLLERLRQEMEQNHCYREIGLSITSLATKLGTQDYLLRRAINQGLGFRNFNQFLHTYRIREARERLRRTKLPVLTIALEAGYSSIGPFNRAFKEMMGMTPTEYRDHPPSSKNP
jgi:AraC-like DNA-binding protein